MKIEKVASNLTKVINGDKEVYFSYATPVAVKVKGVFMFTEKKFSVTTSRHINKARADADCFYNHSAGQDTIEFFAN